jgi:signal peptidase I
VPDATPPEPAVVAVEADGDPGIEAEVEADLAAIVEPLPPTKRTRPSPTRNIIEWSLVVIGAIALTLTVQAFAIKSFYIPSESMVPTLQKGDRVLVNRISYKLHDVNRGDVVVFERPPGLPDTSIKDLIKRVIGLPGDTVEGRNGRIVINGQYLNEPYLGANVITSTFGPVKVGDGMYFVMGDNRQASEDSRVFGPIAEKLIVGRAFVKIWPLNRIGWL